jgi:hypothetical protein
VQYFFSLEQNITMKLHTLLPMFLLGCIAFATFQTVSAQNNPSETTEVVALHDENVTCLDGLSIGEILSLYLDYTFFGFEDLSLFFGQDDMSTVQNTVASSSLSGAPRNVTATQQGTNGVRVAWSPGTGATPIAYNLYMNGQLRSSAIFSTSHTVSPLTPGFYTFTVTAIDTSGRESAHSPLATVTVQSQWPTPRLVSVIQVGPVVGNAGTVQVTWNHIPVGQYNIYRFSGSTWVRVWSGAGTLVGSGTTITGVRATISCPPGTHMFAVTSGFVPSDSPRSNTMIVTVQ